jgi:hypothetical protein
MTCSLFNKEAHIETELIYILELIIDTDKSNIKIDILIGQKLHLPYTLSIS